MHRIRVASRRLRELMPVLQLEADTARKLGKRLRKVTRKLGSRREADVLVQVLDELQKSGRHSERALLAVRQHVLAAARPPRGGQAGPAVAPELGRVARKLERAVRTLEDGESAGDEARGWRWALDARVARRAGRLKARIQDAGTVYVPDRLHAVRIALKKLRYAVELSHEAQGKQRGADLKRLKREQDLLGRLHDLQVLIDRIRQAQTSLRRPELTTWREMDALNASIEATCRRLHARYVRNRSALVDLCDRLIAQVPAAAGLARRVG